MFLSQYKYIQEILENANMINCQPSAKGMKIKLAFEQDISELLQNDTLYRSLNGKLQYLTLTRPDIACLVNVASQFMSKPTKNNFTMIKRILRYLKGTIYHGLMICLLFS